MIYIPPASEENCIYVIKNLLHRIEVINGKIKYAHFDKKVKLITEQRELKGKLEFYKDWRKKYAISIKA